MPAVCLMAVSCTVHHTAWLLLVPDTPAACRCEGLVVGGWTRVCGACSARITHTHTCAGSIRVCVCRGRVCVCRARCPSRGVLCWQAVAQDLLLPPRPSARELSLYFPRLRGIARHRQRARTQQPPRTQAAHVSWRRGLVPVRAVCSCLALAPRLQTADATSLCCVGRLKEARPRSRGIQNTKKRDCTAQPFIPCRLLPPCSCFVRSRQACRFSRWPHALSGCVVAAHHLPLALP
jgi:hypothetical protein